MRLFTAVSLPDPILLRLEAFLAPLRPLAALRWSTLSNLHVTTKFIGEWPVERLPEIAAVLATVTAPDFQLSLGGLGWFPNPRSPHVFWIAVEGGRTLRDLAAATEDKLEALGCPKEKRPFHPHLTLARIKAAADLRALRRALESVGSPAFPAFRVADFHLYQSDSGTYRKLQTFSLVRSSE